MDHHRMKKPNTADTYNDTVYRPRKTNTALDSNMEANAFEFESEQRSPRQWEYRSVPGTAGADTAVGETMKVRNEAMRNEVVLQG